MNSNSPSFSLTASGVGQTAAPGAVVNLGVTVVPGASQAAANGQEILYTASSGSLAAAPGTTVVAQSANAQTLLVETGADGAAPVSLTLPPSPAAVTITAEASYALGHPVATFHETAQ